MQPHFPFEIQPDLPDPALPGADWADAFEMSSTRRFDSMTSAANATVGSMPRWSRRLLWLRNRLVMPLGLKAGEANSLVGGGEHVDFFPVLAREPRRIVLGLDDWHLNFRIVLECRAEGAGLRYRLTTLVQRHNLFGRLYIVLVSPFHKLIVRSVMKHAF